MKGIYGVEIRTSRFLTVAGEPDSAAYPDWAQRYLRNEGRWRAGVHRIHQRRVHLEPLWYTPQVPDPNLYKLAGHGFVGHPETVRHMERKIAETARLRNEEIVSHVLYTGRFP